MTLQHPIRSFFGRRVGHPLSSHQKEQLEQGLEKFQWHPKEVLLENCFPLAITERWMEIGFGSGEHLIQRLKENPTKGFVGVEVFQNGLLKCLQSIPLECQNRIKIIPFSIHEVIHFIPSESFSGLYILFPDPWPKKAHHKRRLIQPMFLDQCERILKKDGILILATDHKDMLHASLEHLEKHPGFIYMEGAAKNLSCYPSIPPHWPTTRYLEKALSQGIHCTYTQWKKHG